MKRKNILSLLSLLAIASGPSAWAADNEGVAANRPPIVSAPADAEYSGTVVDKQTGETLIGVTIGLWKGDDIIGGSTTDIDGHFTLVISDPGCTVRISYTGYKMLTFQPKDLKKDMLIQLEPDTQQLQDVVVTGFVDKNKETFTGSVTQIKGEELRQVTGTNIMTAIAALTPGMEMVVDNAQGSNPNHVPELVLRGMSSFSNQGQDVNQPTIILDGTEISMQELYDLDMNEIESINVLKDASATALYGSKASNGVIVITRKAIASSTIHVAYNFTGNMQYPKLSDYSLLSPTEKLEYERLAGLYDAHKAIDAKTGLPLQYQYDELYNERYKLIQAGQNSDWLAQPARLAFSPDHSLRVYGGAQEIRYELTGRFANTHGFINMFISCINITF